MLRPHHHLIPGPCRRRHPAPEQLLWSNYVKSLPFGLVLKQQRFMLSSCASSCKAGPPRGAASSSTSTFRRHELHRSPSTRVCVVQRLPAVQLGALRASSSRLRPLLRAFDAESTPPEEPDSIKERYRQRVFKELGEVCMQCPVCIIMLPQWCRLGIQREHACLSVAIC